MKQMTTDVNTFSEKCHKIYRETPVMDSYF